jgi:hypothetical protein
MVRFEVLLIPVGTGRWAAQLTSGAIIVADTKRPRTAVAQALLRMGADPRSQMVLRSGAEIIAYDTLGRAAGTSVTCDDAGVEAGSAPPLWQ